MADIRRLENRIRNLEYYTTLSLLKPILLIFLSDSDGLNRFNQDSLLTTLDLSDLKRKMQK